MFQSVGLSQLEHINPDIRLKIKVEYHAITEYENTGLCQLEHINPDIRPKIKVEYHDITEYENTLKKSEKILYVGQRLMYPIMEKIIPYQVSFCFKMPFRF